MDRTEYQVGSQVKGLKVMSIHPAYVRLGAASLEIRHVHEIKVGEEVQGVVVNIDERINAVFFDIGATQNAAALGRKGQLTKNARDYVRDEEALLEVMEVSRQKINVKDLGRKTK